MIEIILLIVLIVLVLFLIFKKNNSNSNTADVEKFSGMIEGQLKTQPDLVSSKIGEVLQTKFGEFKDNLYKNNQEQVKEFGELKTNLSKSLGENTEKLTLGLNTFKETFKKDVNNDFEKLNKTVEDKLDKISNKVMENLNDNFEKTNKTFLDVMKRLEIIDSAQQQMQKLSTDVVSLNDVLNDKKTRGIFGEVQLNQILYRIFGEGNKGKTYDIQHKFDTGAQSDAVLLLPEPFKKLAIDSKFPLENYKKSLDKSLSSQEIEQYKKLFKQDLKKHIDDIASKYIIQSETADQAVMFLPAESIFAEIQAFYEDVVTYSQKKRVWLVSPTTLMAVLTSIQIMLKDAERSKYTQIIQEQLIKLSEEFSRYKIRWDRLSKDIEKVSNDVRDINTTTTKISTKFEQISNVEVEDEKLLEEVLPLSK